MFLFSARAAPGDPMARCAPVVLRHGSLLVHVNEARLLADVFASMSASSVATSTPTSSSPDLLGALASAASLIQGAASTAMLGQRFSGLRDVEYAYRTLLPANSIRMMKQINAAYSLARRTSAADLAAQAEAIARAITNLADRKADDEIVVETACAAEPTPASADTAFDPWASAARLLPGQVASRVRALESVAPQACPAAAFGSAAEPPTDARGGPAYAALYALRRAAAAQ